MWKRVIPLTTISALLLVGVACAQSHPGWTQLSWSTCAVDEFLAKHPDSDGRGVVIAIFDTGVDPSIPGLTHTPDGQVKVIDVQDFSGQGDVDLYVVRLDEASGKLIDHDDEGVALEFTPPPLSTSSEPRRFWFGKFEESLFVNSDVSDLDDNGSTDDVWTVLITALEGDGDDQAVFYVDTNHDRSFADEQPLQNYKLKFDTFVFQRPKPERQIIPLTFAVNIFLRQAKVVLHWDDGAHGTHVAGIAAGYRINDQDGLNGVAPGAKVISCKIGNGIIGSPSTTESIKKSFEYCAKFAREHGVPVVCNMSFGVESEIERNSDIDKFVDEFLQAHPYLIYCTSAGNEGPGLSSVGTPAAAYHAISVGALMAADSARDVRGFRMEDAAVTPFSSRGGETAKPDVVAPGWSTSTVPRHVTRGDFWSGTSMASPYVAGLCAVLVSDVLSRDSRAAVRAWDVRRALELSGRPIKGLNELDYGWGVPELPKAAEILGRLVKRADGGDPIIGYKLTTACPQAYKGSAEAAYWRGLWYPAGEDRQTFTVAPIFAPGADANAKTQFTRKYDLRSNADWIKVAQQTVYLRSEQTAQIYVEYDATKLDKPGLYVGTVDALCDGMIEFRLVNSIVVPYEFSPDNDHTLKLQNLTVNGWEPYRIFLAVPPGASALKMTLAAPEGRDSRARFEYVFDPAGHGSRIRSAMLNPDGGEREIVRTLTEDLYPGVWEVPIISNQPDKAWPFDFEAKFFGLQAVPNRVTEWKGGGKPSGEIIVTNMFTKRVLADADGQLEGYREHHADKFEGLKHTLEYPVKIESPFKAVRIRLEMTPEAYAATTDIAVLLKKDDGESVSTGAFSNRIYETTVGKAGSYTLEITGGFAWADDKRETPITVDIDYLLADPIAIKVGRNGESPVNFVPGVAIPIEFRLQAKPEAPKGKKPIGYLRFRERGSQDEALRVPVEIG